MKGLFIPEITAEMFRNGCLESIEQLMAEGEIYDIDYPLEQEPKTGHWILVDEESNTWKCTNCIEEGKDDWWQLNHGTPQDNKMDYCPHCGARMIEPQESEE